MKRKSFQKFSINENKKIIDVLELFERINTNLCLIVTQFQFLE